MEQKIIGRKAEQETLKNCYESGKSEFVAGTSSYMGHLVRPLP